MEDPAGGACDVEVGKKDPTWATHGLDRHPFLLAELDKRNGNEHNSRVVVVVVEFV